MRLKQLWQRLSARERVLGGVALLALLLVVIRYGIVESYLAYTAHLEEEIEQEVQRVAKMQRQRDRREQIATQVNILRQRFQETRQRLIPGGTPALAAAHLQERIQTLASQSGLELVTTQVMRDEAVGEFRKIAVQVTLRGELPAVADFVAGVEYGDWLLAVMTLEARSTYNLRVRPKEGPRNPLTITLEVGGVMQGVETPAATQEG
jgi:type II secretory pathway component PulM